jgi:hypothetical protein
MSLLGKTPKSAAVCMAGQVGAAVKMRKAANSDDKLGACESAVAGNWRELGRMLLLLLLKWVKHPGSF